MANLLTGEIKRDETIYDLAYKGKTAAVKILLDENPKLVTQPDDVKYTTKIVITIYLFI